MKSIFYSYLIIVLVLSGCSSGKSTFERGNYYEAVLTAVNRLRRNSDHKKSAETLRQAYPMAVSYFEDRAKTSLASSERFKWSEVVRSYTAINTMYDEIKRCPGALAVIPYPVNYYAKLQEAKQNAAEENYAAGILALQTGTRDNAKLAYGYFKIANEYVPGYKEVKSYLEAALSAATVKIVVEPVPVHSKSVGVSAEFFNDKISEFVHSASINEFVRFYTRAEAQKVKLSPDHIVQLQFDEFTVGEVYKQEKEIHLVRDSVVMGTYVASSGGGDNTNGKQQPPGNGNGLVVTGKTSPNNQNAEAERERAAREQADKLRLEREAGERAIAEKQKADKELAEKEKMAAERAAKEAAEKESKSKEAADAEKRAREAEQALADKSAAERDAAQKANMEREKAEKENNERAAKENADKMKAEKEKADKEQADKAKAEKEMADKDQAEKMKAEKERAEKEHAEKVKAEKEKAEKEHAEKMKAEKEKAEKEHAEKEKLRVEKEKAEREEKEKTAKAETAKGKAADPTILVTDTLNVTDPVFICHVAPGNKAITTTLRINRSALKAHLAHGDTEGDCTSDKGKQSATPANDGKQKGQDQEQKSQPQENKAKGGKGSASIRVNENEYSLLVAHNQILIASRDNNAAAILRYVDYVTDTNKVYGTVKATLHHYTKTTTSRGIVSFKIIDAKTGALLAVQKMPGEFVWKSEWATFNGDERALSSEQLQLTRQKEQPAPAPQQLFIEFTRPIYDQITTKLKEFYKSY